MLDTLWFSGQSRNLRSTHFPALLVLQCSVRHRKASAEKVSMQSTPCHSLTFQQMSGALSTRMRSPDREYLIG
jgi:hypothetical protein